MACPFRTFVYFVFILYYLLYYGSRTFILSFKIESYSYFVLQFTLYLKLKYMYLNFLRHLYVDIIFERYNFNLSVTYRKPVLV